MTSATGSREGAGDAYAEAGVDIDKGDRFVDAIKPVAAATTRPGVVDGLGGFGAFFDLKSAGYVDPILVAATDGVGTKLKIAIETGRHRTIGIDLVAMCVNDLVVQGAEPLFFLDYYATGQLDPEIAVDVVAGIAEGCRRAGSALIGGETAEMPGMYRAGDYDLAGFAVGAVERGRQLTGADIRKGDVVLGLASSGIHSNGYSLVRRIVERSGMSYDAPAPFHSGLSLGEALLSPTRIYVRPLLKAIAAGGVRGLAHITGGGLVGNVPRVLPRGLGVEIDARSWSLPPVFRWLMAAGKLTVDDLARVFNAGIGMVVIAEAARADVVSRSLAEAGETVHRIGEVVADEARTARILGAETGWRE